MLVDCPHVHMIHPFQWFRRDYHDTDDPLQQKFPRQKPADSHCASFEGASIPSIMSKCADSDACQVFHDSILIWSLSRFGKTTLATTNLRLKKVRHLATPCTFFVDNLGLTLKIIHHFLVMILLLFSVEYTAAKKWTLKEKAQVKWQHLRVAERLLATTKNRSPEAAHTSVESAAP